MAHGLTCTVFRAEIYHGDLWVLIVSVMWAEMDCLARMVLLLPPPGSWDSLEVMGGLQRELWLALGPVIETGLPGCW